MLCGRESSTILMSFALLIIIMPVHAYSIAMDGTNAGLNPDLHKDSGTGVTSIMGLAGSDLDRTIDPFIQLPVDALTQGGHTYEV